MIKSFVSQKKLFSDGINHLWIVNRDGMPWGGGGGGLVADSK